MKPLIGLRWGFLLLLIILGVLIGGGSVHAAKMRDRTFPELSLAFVDTAALPLVNAVGITYDRQHDRFITVTQNPEHGTEMQLYPFALKRQSVSDSGRSMIELNQPLPLIGADQQPFTAKVLDVAGIALSAEHSVFITTQQADEPNLADPRVCEFDRVDGHQRGCLKLPERYLSAVADDELIEPQIPVHFTGLTLIPGGIGVASIDPFPLFLAATSPRNQDLDPTGVDPTPKLRWLQYLLNSGDRPFWIAEYAYPLESALAELRDILALKQSGYFFSLEQTQSEQTVNGTLYEVAVGDAKDTSRVDSLKGLSTVVKPMRKRSLLSLDTLEPRPTALTSMTLGPRLADGTQSLVILGRVSLPKGKDIPQLWIFSVKSKYPI
jgi:hypothetical protein